MALLSNESILFEELNLVKNGDKPKDFYNFLLHKLLSLFKTKFDNGDIVVGEGSYERLFSFI